MVNNVIKNRIRFQGKSYAIKKEWIVGDCYCNCYATQAYLTSDDEVILRVYKSFRRVPNHECTISLARYERQFESIDDSYSRALACLRFLDPEYEAEN